MNKVVCPVSPSPPVSSHLVCFTPAASSFKCESSKGKASSTVAAMLPPMVPQSDDPPRLSGAATAASRSQSRLRVGLDPAMEEEKAPLAPNPRGGDDVSKGIPFILC